MSTTTTTTGLRQAAAALHDAELALGQNEDRQTHEALLALARASYRSLASFEQESLPTRNPGTRLHERLLTWRQELDEMRVQLALAEMEARDAGADIFQRVERIADRAAGRFTDALREMADVVADVRRGLTDRAS